MTDLIDRSKCTALLITCSDFRFQSAARRYVEAHGLVDDYDVIARPGAIRSLVLPRTAAMRESMELEIRLLWSLHQFKDILFLNHVSCRAYDDIADETNEIDVHTEHLRAAERLVETWFDDIDVQPHLLMPIEGEIAVADVGASKPQ